MIDISKASNQELDELAQRNDAALRKVYDFLGRFVVYPSEHARVAHALWVLHAHLMDRWDTTPRIAFLSVEPASGKSRALEATEPLVPFPVVAVNVSPAYLFRKVGAKEGATILYDEIDTVFGAKAKDNEEIRALLNAGHRRGAVAGRCVVHGKTVVTEEISAYAAVAVAGLGWLPDTILSRSVIVRMRRRRVDEQVEPFRRRIIGPEAETIRHLIELWTRSVPAQIAWPTMPPEIQDRDADVWEPLLAVADLAGDDWPRRARRAAKALIEAAKEAEPSFGILLLTDLRAVFGDADKMATETILQKLCEIEEAPWRDLKGKPLDGRGLARRVREYGIKSRTVRIGNATPRGYERKDFLDAWSRYLPSPATSATSTTSATTGDETVAASPKTVENQYITHDAHIPASAMNGSGVSHVADVALPAGQGGNGSVKCRPGLCAQCRGEEGEPPTLHTGANYRPEGIWLHKECARFWAKQ
jgi:hypothetical protein